MRDWQQLLRYVRGDQDAKLPKDRFAALIESTDARIRELEDKLDEAMVAPVLHDKKTWMRETVDEYETALVAREVRIRELEAYAQRMEQDLGEAIKKSVLERNRIEELQAWKQSVIDGLVVAEIIQPEHETDPKMALNDFIEWHMRFQYALHQATIRDLETQIAEHEKVCAGVWVPCSERLPDEEGLYVGIVHFEKSRTFPKGTGSKGIRHLWFDGGGKPSNSWNGHYTHWLDARMPGEETP